MIRNDLVPAIEREYIKEISKPNPSKVVLKEKEKISYKQKLKKVATTSRNIKHKNGRIHTYDIDGNYASHSVSPYSKEFLYNIEDGVQDLALALVKKGYLPISSCEGHSYTSNRHICLCFRRPFDAMNFSVAISELKFLTCTLLKPEDFLNISAKITDHGYFEGVENVVQVNKKKAIDYLEAFFMQKGKDWCILQIEIVTNLDTDSKLDIFKRYLYKKFLLDRDTKKFVEHVKTLENYEAI